VKEEHSDFSEFKSDVESLGEWLRSLGIKFEKGRIASYTRTQKEIAEHIAKGNPAESESSTTFAQQADNFHDVSELLFVQEHLSDYDSKILRAPFNLQLKVPFCSPMKRRGLAMRATESSN
jgi:hypothetical protein